MWPSSGLPRLWHDNRPLGGRGAVRGGGRDSIGRAADGGADGAAAELPGSPPRPTGVLVAAAAAARPPPSLAENEAPFSSVPGLHIIMETELGYPAVLEAVSRIP